MNKDLADVLGNFVSRITKFCRAKFGEVVPDGGDYGPQEIALVADLQARLTRYQAHMEAIEIRKAAAELRAIWVVGNEYLQSAGPWTIYKDDPDRAAAITRLALNLIPFYAGLSAPFIPDAAASMAGAMGVDVAWPESAETALSALPPGHAFRVPEVMFAKIDDDTRAEWARRFAGVRS